MRKIILFVLFDVHIVIRILNDSINVAVGVDDVVDGVND